MANSIVTPVWVMKEIGRRLTNNWRFANNVRRSYDGQYKVQGAKVGDTVKARLPQRYIVSKGAALVKTSVENKTVDLTISDQAHVGLEFGMFALTLDVDNYREAYLDPAVDALVNQVDFDGLYRMYQSVFWTVGTPGVPPGSTGTLPQAASVTYGQAVVKLQNGAVPPPYIAMLNPAMQMYLTTAHQAQFNPQNFIGKAFREGQFSGEALGINEWFTDQNVAVHTVGALGTVPLASAANQTGSSVTITGATVSVTGYLKKGDVVQFAGSYATNPQNHQSTQQLQDFVVTADVNTDGSGNATVPISPQIITSGPYQTVTASPTLNGAMTTFGHATSYAGLNTAQGLVYHKDAFALVMADLEKPQGIWVSERLSNKALGISVRFLKDYRIDDDQSPGRLDLIYGWSAMRPEMACRVCA